MEPSKPPHAVPGEYFLLVPDTTRRRKAAVRYAGPMRGWLSGGGFRL